ncbi:hypothetical protein SRRS_33430 [Sporomusa rhizae]
MKIKDLVTEMEMQMDEYRTLRWQRRNRPDVSK